MTDTTAAIVQTGKSGGSTAGRLPTHVEETSAGGPADAPVDVMVVGAGQSGLAAGRALQLAGLTFQILEAAGQVGGSWPSYYDSLTLFSPARFSALPGVPLPGRPNRYPARDEITAYLRDYAARFDLPVRTHSRVTHVAWDGHTFHHTLSSGDQLAARAVVAASGGFGRPHIPGLPGLAGFTNTLLHAARYRRPEPFAGQRSSSSAPATPRSRSPLSSPTWPTSPWPAGCRSGSGRNGH